MHESLTELTDLRFLSLLCFLLKTTLAIGIYHVLQDLRVTLQTANHNLWVTKSIEPTTLNAIEIS